MTPADDGPAPAAAGLTARPLHTARLDLLPLRVAHADEMAAALADPSLHLFIGGTPDTAEALRARYGRLTAGSPDPDVVWLNWVIRLRSESRLTGTVQATVHPPDPAHHGEPRGRTAEVAWVVGTPWQGRGIATEAARALVTWLAEHPEHPEDPEPPVRTVVAHVHPDHHASAAVAAAAGLSPTAEWHDGERRWRGSVER